MKKFFDPLTSDILCKVKNDVAVFPHYHRHDGCEIFLLLNGTVNYYIEQHCYPLSRGSLILINPEEYHRSELADHTVYERITLNVKSSFFQSLPSSRTDLSACFFDRPCCERNLIQLSNQDLQEFLVLSRQLQSVLEDHCFGCDLLALSLLLQLLVKVNQLYLASSEQETPAPPDLMPVLIRDVMAYIEEHLTEPISLAELSGQFFHNGTYISRRFKSVTGLTISQYILYKRIGLAQKYLRNGVSLTDSCWMSGFSNYSNFCRSFTRQVGSSPKEYQNAHTPPRKILTISGSIRFYFAASSKTSVPASPLQKSAACTEVLFSAVRSSALHRSAA